jgi:membrane protein YdbS with pleckstrin-like domain
MIIQADFVPASHQPRGFQGRPIVALLFAVTIGILAYYVSAWTHASGLTTTLATIVIVGTAGYVWHRLEKPK